MAHAQGQLTDGPQSLGADDLRVGATSGGYITQYDQAPCQTFVVVQLG